MTVVSPSHARKTSKTAASASRIRRPVDIGAFRSRCAEAVWPGASSGMARRDNKPASDRHPQTHHSDGSSIQMKTLATFVKALRVLHTGYFWETHPRGKVRTKITPEIRPTSMKTTRYALSHHKHD